MSDRTGNKARKVRARTVVEEAKAGELPKIDEYTLQKNGPRGQKITIGEILMRNTDAEVGDDIDVYADLRAGLAVIDLNSGKQGNHDD